jgi:hypothetical protein
MKGIVRMFYDVESDPFSAVAGIRQLMSQFAELLKPCS